ncbi:MAG TPA: hypothetical protein VF444_07755 [Pseudonocardiaceae bacterium]
MTRTDTVDQSDAMGVAMPEDTGHEPEPQKPETVTKGLDSPPYVVGAADVTGPVEPPGGVGIPYGTFNLLDTNDTQDNDDLKPPPDYDG